MASSNLGVQTNRSKEFLYEDCLNMIGFGKVQVEVLLVTGLLLMAVISESMGMSIITIASQCDLNSDSEEKGIMGAACLVGIVVASYPCGYLADTIGRRIVVVQTTIAAIAFSAMSSFVWNLWVFVLLRFLTGVGIAGASSIIVAYLGEFNTMKHRPIVINYASIFVGFAYIYTPAVAWILLPQTWGISFFGLFVFRPWRLLVLFNLLPGLIGTIWLWTLPETPKLYLAHGKKAEALKVLYWIYEKNTGRPSKEFKVKQLVSEENEEFIHMITDKKTSWQIVASMWKQSLPLYRPPLVRNFLISCFVMFGLFFMSSGMGLWFPEIQNRLGIGQGHIPMSICEVIHEAYVVNGTENSTLEEPCTDEISTKMYVDSIILGTSYVVTYIILGFVLNPLGRKTVLSGSLMISGLSGLSLQFIDKPIIIVSLFCLFIMLPGLTISVLIGAIVELIPTHLRGKAVCISLMVGRLGGVIASYLIGIILENYCALTFYIFSGLILLCGFLASLLPI